MSSFYKRPPTSDEIYHHGILGQKWGVRRYQNKDGTLTESGKKHYGSKSDKKNGNDVSVKPTKTSSTEDHKGLSDKQKNAIKIGAAATATALAVVGTAYLVKSGKGEAFLKTGEKAIKSVSNSALTKGKNAVDKVVNIDNKVRNNVNKVFENTSKGKIRNMSDDALKDYVGRKVKEKEAYKLTHPVRADAKEILNKTVKTAAAGAAAYLIGSTVDKRLDKNQLGDYMRRGGSKKK